MSKLVLILAAALSLLLCLLLFEARAQRKVYRAWTKAEIVNVAASHASRADKPTQMYLRYVDLSGIAPRDRLEKIQTLGYVVNSLSRTDLLAPVKAVAGTELAVAYFDLSLLRDRDDSKGLAQLCVAFDDLGRLGSGPAPFPEPYFHAVVTTKVPEEVVSGYSDQYAKEATETYTAQVRKKDSYGRDYTVLQKDGRWLPEYETVTRTRVVPAKTAPRAKARAKGKKVTVALASHLDRATAIGLAAIARTEFFVFDYRWFLANALVEPRYHELLGLDDTEDSAKKLAFVDEALAAKAGSQLRGAALFSEVAHHNRVLLRTPTQSRNGRGTYWESKDFKTSVDLQDVLKDLLIDRADAEEIIFTLPNGLQGFFVIDADGKRLDKADGDVANNKRSKFKDTQVRTAYMCIGCHLPDKGWIAIEDEVRELAKKQVTLIADAFGKGKGKDTKRGDRIRQQYLSDDINELIAIDQALVEASVKRATVGLDSSATARHVIDTIYDYNEGKVDIAVLSRDLGHPTEAVEFAMRTTGLDPVFASIASGRKGRRDQIEAGFNQIATILYLSSVKE